MALDSFQKAVISTLQLHNSAVILALSKDKFDRAGLIADLAGQGEMLLAIEQGQAELDRLFATNPSEDGS